jgi:hypothetical protein
VLNDVRPLGKALKVKSVDSESIFLDAKLENNKIRKKKASIINANQKKAKKKTYQRQQAVRYYSQ